jgi:heme A synthase
MLALARFAWFVLAYNVAVIGWGAYVRATGSGAGCGNHWPLCNGDVLPRSAAAATLIEYSHRVTSGLALLCVLALFAWVFRSHRAGHPARAGASLSLFFIVTEAAVGAGLVLFELVADNATMARAMFMVVHLVNTFLLLGALTLTAWWCSGAPALTLRGNSRTAGAAVLGCAALLVSGASGAVAALGDTLFPAASLGEALAADLSASSHLLIRLRVLHPVIAIATAAIVIAVAARLPRAAGAPGIRRTLVGLTLLQIGLGIANVLLLAPVWLQLVHLLAADGIWIAFVLLSAASLAATTPAAVVRAA